MEKRKRLIGKVQMKSNLTIMDLGKVISEEILGGTILDGLEKNIYDEVPAIFAQKGLLGFSVILQGYEGINNEIGYWFELIPNFSENKSDAETVNLSKYLTSLFLSKIANNDIVVIDEIAS